MFEPNFNRREFMSSLSQAVGAGAVLSASLPGAADAAQNKSWTVGEIMDLFIRQVPGAPFAQTVDTLKAGTRELRVKGIATTMFATVEVIRQAIALNANFIIAHEPTFYNHLDETDWLEGDPVYRFKADLLKKHNIAVWRNHDYVHRLERDGVMAGVVQQLGWESFAVADKRNVFDVPPTTLSDLIGQVKEKLGLPGVRYIGTPTQRCKKILLMPGASGGRNQISSLAREKPDTILCGEISEWETAEYVRDARAKGDHLALVVLGHVASEEGGSAFMANWLKDHVKGVTTTHIPAGNSLMFA